MNYGTIVVLISSLVINLRPTCNNKICFFQSYVHLHTKITIYFVSSELLDRCLFCTEFKLFNYMNFFNPSVLYTYVYSHHAIPLIQMLSLRL